MCWPLKPTTLWNNSVALWPIKKHWLSLCMSLDLFFTAFSCFSPSFSFLCAPLTLHPPLCLFILLSVSSVSSSPSQSLLSPSLSKWVSSGVLAGRNHLRANTLLSVVKASPQIPFYTHKCHFPFVCTLAALAEPCQPRASSQTHPVEEN